ncbi:MAG TPA: response regulator transcription factor [Bacteroidota bacterium]|nr:response regulator transcription factor [Bacteroidota bacterium]
MIRVIIADDHPMVREGLKKTLSEEVDIRIIGEARTAQETRALVSETEADVLVLDISMPGTSGLSLLQDIVRLKKDLRVLILSMHPEERFAIRALKEGASGYLTKEAAPEELARAIRKIATGRRYISPNLAEKIVEDLQSDNPALPHELLSEREYEIFLMIASGKTVSAIAEELALSVATVSTHRRRILEKMKLSTNADIVQYAYANNLIT